MKNKMLVICKSLLWCFIILLFPIISGTLSAIFSMGTVATLFLQSAFMAMALIIPAFFVFSGKWKWNEIGFAQINVENCKSVLYFVPLLIIFVPVAIEGFYIKSIGYVLGNLLLYLFVGISEEVYFRGIIPRYLKEQFSPQGQIILSSIIFGIGHIATAFAGSNGFEIALTVINALIFGWLAMEMTIISSNIVPAIILHFLFDFETKIVVMSGRDLLIAEGVRGLIMFIIAVCLAVMLFVKKKYATKEK